MTEFSTAERQESKFSASLTRLYRPSAFTFELKPSSEGRELNFEKHDCENGLTASKKLKTGRSVPNVEMLFASWSIGFNKIMVDDVLCDMINLEQQKAVFHGSFAQFLGLVEFWHRDFLSFEKRISNVCIGIDFDATVVDHEFLDQEAGKLLERLNDFSLKFSVVPSFEDEMSKIQNLVRIVVELRGKLNGMWTEFKLIFNATSARLNGAEMRPKAKPEARAQNFRVRNNVRVRSEFFQGESIGQRLSNFVENVDQGVESQSKLFTWDDASTTTEGRSAALEQHPGLSAHGRTQSRYKQSQRRVNFAHGQSQNTHVNDSMLTSPFQNFISDPTTDRLPDSKDHNFECVETTPTRGALDCNKSFKGRTDVNVLSSAKSEHCGTNFYDAVSNGNGQLKGNSCKPISRENFCTQSGKLKGHLSNVVSGAVLQAKSGGSAVNSQNIFPIKVENCGVNSFNVAPCEISNAKGEHYCGSENNEKNLGTVQYESTFYYPGDSEKRCQAPAPPPVGKTNHDSGNERVENQLFELIKIQTQAMQQQTQVFQRQNELREHEVLMKGANIQLKDLPVFDGKDGFALVKFWKEFDRCRSIGRWTTVSALSWLKSSLRGIASKEFDAAGPFDDLGQARQALNDRFLRDEDRWAASIELSNLRQLQNESVTQYFYKFDDMAEVAHGDSPPPNLMATFINGLFSTEFQRIIQRQRPKTLSEAFRFAKEEEAFCMRPFRMEIQNQNQDFQGNNFQVNDSGGVLNEQVNAVLGGVGRERARCENRTRFQGRICYVCRGKGHFAKDCLNNVQRHECEMNEGYQGQGCVGRARYNNYQCGGY